MPLYPSLFRLPFAVRWLLLGCAVAVLFKTSMRSGTSGIQGPVLFNVDFIFNLGHQFLYGYFVFALLLVLSPLTPLRRKTWIWLPCLVFAVGILDEWNQSFRFRDSGLNDVVSDVVGCFQVLLLAVWFSKPRKQHLTALLLSTLVLIGVSWNFVVVFAPDPPLPFFASCG